MEKGDIKFIYWFAYYNLDSPSVRYRAKYPLDFAREHLGISSTLILPGYSYQKLWKFIKAYFSALLFPKRNSLIVIQRVRSNFIYSNCLKLLVIFRRNLTVYDLDDADYLEGNPDTIHFFARNCMYVSAGSLEIVNYLKKFNKNVLHTTSPTPDLGLVKSERNRVFTIGWIGNFGWGHKDSLYLYLFPALKELPFECKLILIGVNNDSDEQEIREYFREHDRIRIEAPRILNWNDEKILQEKILELDVGIATLLNHPIQLAKSGIKAKQYLNNGVPVICNNLPENNKVVVDGYNGFVCNSSQEFLSKLVELKEMDDTAYWRLSKNSKRSSKDFDHFKWFADLSSLVGSTTL